ncbi:hypothetical protein [Streptomyces sp. NRRL WC-3742]|uniref:hypothetical protein n=1 Tax=Streptomyces sp. NRRL WC-3742 TaxID=1463934 RepID=UPI000ACD3BEA|nr:hypothetical protein [Streptomyces sp. NRRL WC-3742]
MLADLQWSFPVTLALAVAAWLLVAGVSISLVPELARGNQPSGPAPAPQSA